VGSVGGVRARARRMFVRVVGAVMVATGLVAIAPAGPASAAEWYDSAPASWYDGGISYSQVLNCYSVIQGSPYYEAGIGAYTGYIASPNQGRPAVGDSGYIRYAVYGLGNPCAGGSYFAPTFYLPPGMEFDRSKPILCGYDGSGGAAPQANCPGWGNLDASNTYWNNGSGQGGNMWGVAQGHHWEFQFPVRFTQQMTNRALQIHVNVADGNNNPRVLVEAPIYAFATPQTGGGGGGTVPGTGGIQIMYDQPSTVNATTFNGGPADYGLVSTFSAIVAGRGGSAGVQIGTDPTMNTAQGEFALSFPANTYSSVTFSTDWYIPGSLPGLSYGSTYYWRGYVDSGGTRTYGAIQSFKLKPGGGLDGGAASGPMPSTGQPGSLGSGGVSGGTLTPIPVPQPPTPTPPAAPTATASVAKSAKAKKGVKVTIACTGACTAKVSATVPKKIAKKLGVKKGSLGTGNASLTAAGSKVVTIKLSKAVQKKLKKLKKVSATVKVTTTVAGTTSSKTWKVTIKG
jgi:hypothetical protein